MPFIKPKVSIIVPVYNAGDRFIKCLETLVNQTLQEIEIILVLDCPTDGSDNIAKQYAANDKRIIIIENETNLHIGESRNVGLKIAKGEYIGFSDHDDYRELTMYERLYSYATQQNADIVLSLPVYVTNGVKEIYEFNSDIINLKKAILKDLISFGEDFYKGGIFVCINNNLYRSDFIKSVGVLFVDTKHITPEDVLFQIEIINKSECTCILNKGLYYHLFHESNEGRKYSYLSYKKRGAGMNVIYEYLNRENIYNQYKNDFHKGVVKQFINSLSGALFPKMNIILFLKAAKHLRSYSFCKEAFTHYTLPKPEKGIANRLFRRLLIWLLTC